MLSDLINRVNILNEENITQDNKITESSSGLLLAGDEHLENVHKINSLYFKSKDIELKIFDIKTLISNIKYKLSTFENINISFSSQLLDDINDTDNIQEISLDDINNILINIESKNFYDTYYRVFNTEIKNNLQDNAISIIRDANNNLNVKINTEESKNTTQDTNITSLATRITDIESKESTQDTSIASLTTRITATESKNTTQDTSIASLTTRITATESKNTTQDSSITSLTTKITGIENTESFQDSNITSLTSRITDIETKESSQDSTIISLTKKVSDVEPVDFSTDIDLLTTRITKVEDVESFQDTNISNLFTRLAYVDSKNDTQNKNITSFTTRITGIETKDTTQDTNITALTTRIVNTESKESSQDSTITLLTSRIISVESKESSQDSTITAGLNKVATLVAWNNAQNIAINNLFIREYGYESPAIQNNAIASLTTKISTIEAKDTTQDTSITSLTSRVSTSESKNTNQDLSISNLFPDNTYYNVRGIISSFNDGAITVKQPNGISDVYYIYERRGYSESLTISSFSIITSTTITNISKNGNSLFLIIGRLPIYDSYVLNKVPLFKTEWIEEDKHLHNFSVLTTTNSGHAHYAQGNTSNTNVFSTISYPLFVYMISKESNTIAIGIKPMSDNMTLQISNCLYVSGFKMSWGYL
jgi:uncharacterized coiled-coil protein SlyX